MTGLGIGLSTRKCFVFGVAGRGRSWVPKTITVTTQGAVLKNVASTEEFRCLGAHFSVNEGLSNWNNSKKVLEAAERCNALRLKPRQKLDLLCRYDIPGYAHLLISDIFVYIFMA